MNNCEINEPELFASCDKDCDYCFANKNNNPYLLDENQINEMVSRINK